MLDTNALVTDHDVIHLKFGNLKLDWDDHNGRLSEAETSAGSSNWIMKKCIGTADQCASGATGDNHLWTSATSSESPLKTCDYISWFNPYHGRSFDCAWGEGHGCSSQPYPPPRGHWGTPFKIYLKNTATGHDVACGTEIKNGATDVFFRAQLR
jgi:hypothetical protein